MPVKRKIYLINPQFQLRMSFYIAFIVFITSLIYPFIIYDLIESLSIKLSVIKPELVSSLNDKRNSLIGVLALVQGIFFLFVFIVSIFFTHRIAGPIYKLSLFLNKLAKGEKLDALRFRKGDFFQEIPPLFNQAFKSSISTLSRDESIKIEETLKEIENNLPDHKKYLVESLKGRF